MKLQRLQELAGIPINEGNYDEVEELEAELVRELEPIALALDGVMEKYPHASWDDVLDWLKQ